MAKTVIMPKMGQTMEEGTIIEWLVKEGDKIERGDALFRFESDKAALEAESTAGGTVLKLLYAAGAVVPILLPVAIVGEPGEDISALLAGAPAAASAAAAPVKAEEPAPAALPATPAHVPGERIFASPRARHAAAQAGIDLAQIAGSGPDGRIVEKDVLAFAAAQPKATPMARRLAAEAGLPLSEVAGSGGRLTKADVARSLAPAPAAAPAQPAPGAGQIIPMSGVRAIIAERMSASAHTVAPVTLFTEVDATRLVELRESFKRTPLAGDIVPSYNDLLVMIVAKSLQEHPTLNARLVENRIELLTQINVGVAVDTERGLLVPVVRDVAGKKLGQIASDFREMVNRARKSQSLPDDLSGGTFTITNLGMFDIDGFTPIINLPECAILGVGRIVAKPVVMDGQIAVRQMLALSLTFDHRINDGAPAARFLQRIKQLIEQPYLLLA